MLSATVLYLLLALLWTFVYRTIHRVMFNALFLLCTKCNVCWIGVECFKPVQPHYNITNLHKDAYIAGRNVTIECEAGYLLVGNATITCSKHGTWKPHLPTCVPISMYMCMSSKYYCLWLAFYIVHATTLTSNSFV